MGSFVTLVITLIGAFSMFLGNQSSPQSSPTSVSERPAAPGAIETKSPEQPSGATPEQIVQPGAIGDLSNPDTEALGAASQ